MFEIAPPRNFTPGLCKAIEAEILRAFAEVDKRHGLVSEGLGVQAMDLPWNFEFGVRVSTPLPDGSTLDPKRMLFEVLAEEFGLLPDDFGREFSTGRERFRVAGIDPCRPKYPISDGKGYKYTAENAALLRKAVRRERSGFVRLATQAELSRPSEDSLAGSKCGTGKRSLCFDHSKWQGWPAWVSHWWPTSLGRHSFPSVGWIRGRIHAEGVGQWSGHAS